MKMCMGSGVSCHVGKSDMSMAFRHIPLGEQDWPLLILKAKHPITGRYYSYVHKCLPFGAAISCAIFQDFSNSVAHKVSYKNNKPVLNYLDDFFFAAFLCWLCNQQVNTFLQICQMINFPASFEKTYWGTKLLVFLGLLLDTVEQMVRIPKEKILKAREWIQFFLDPKRKKVTVKQIQMGNGLFELFMQMHNTWTCLYMKDVQSGFQQDAAPPSYQTDR